MLYRLYLFLFLCLTAVLAHADYLKDLEEQGYCVVPQVLSRAEAEQLYERVWHEYIEKIWPNCRMEDRSNWKEAFPMHNKFGIFVGAAGQTQIMWDLRQDPRIVEVYAQVWNTHALIVSMDGISIMCPPEIRDGYFAPWPHVDQSILKERDVPHNNKPPAGFVSESLLSTKPYTIQGQFLFEDSSEGDGGFYCIPKSHLRFPEFVTQLEDINALEVSKEEKEKMKDIFLHDLFGAGTDESLYPIKHVVASRGSLILWDSRTLHWSQHPSKTRAHSDTPKVRMVGYLSYVPKARLTDEGRALRKEAFDKGICTGHNPAYPQLKPTQIKGNYEQFLEDPSYTPPKPQLSLLGESLLGFEVK